MYFQDSSGGVREAKHDVGVWTGGDRESAIFKAKLFTPLAVVSNKDGKEVGIQTSMTRKIKLTVNFADSCVFPYRREYAPGVLLYR